MVIGFIPKNYLKILQTFGCFSSVLKVSLTGALAVIHPIRIIEMNLYWIFILKFGDLKEKNVTVANSCCVDFHSNSLNKTLIKMLLLSYY